MNPNDIEDLDFSSMFEGLTDKLGTGEVTASFLSEDNALTYAAAKEKLFMELLSAYEYEVSEYLNHMNVDTSKVLALQEVLIKHKSI